MNPDSPLTIYAVSGPMGSGKTTLALKIAKGQSAFFQSLDGTIKNLNEPIGDLQGYERLMPADGHGSWNLQMRQMLRLKFTIFKFQLKKDGCEFKNVMLKSPKMFIIGR